MSSPSTQIFLPSPSSGSSPSACPSGFAWTWLIGEIRIDGEEMLVASGCLADLKIYVILIMISASFQKQKQTISSKRFFYLDNSKAAPWPVNSPNEEHEGAREAFKPPSPVSMVSPGP